jgi:hypothetical protein
MADPDPYAEFDAEADPYAEFLDAPTPQEIAPPRRAKTLVPRTGVGSALEALGLLDPALERVGAPKVGEGETFVNKAVNMVPLGGLLTDLGTTVAMLAARPSPGARLTPQALAELRRRGETVETQPGPIDTYRQLRDVRRARTEAGEEQNPMTALAGSGTGFGLSMLAPGPKFTPKGGADAGLLSRMWAGAKTGGAYGGVAGLTSGDADTAAGDIAGTVTQGLLGAGFGGLLGGSIPALAAGARRLYQGLVKPTPAAQALQQEGVKGLTLGQMDPKSAVGIYEGAAQANPVAGPVLAGQREAAVDSMRHVAFKRAVAPDASPPADDLTPPQAIAHLRKGFNAAYDEIRDTKMPTLPIDRLLVAADDQSVIATEADRVAVGNFLKNQMSRLPPSGTETTAGMFIKIREKIREEIVKATRSGSMERASLLERAEDELTEGLNNTLPEAAAQKLKSTDAAYRNFKIVQDAVGSAGDMAAGPGMFTPKMLSSAVERATGDTSYAELGGGPLRRLSSNAAQVFQEPPKTGWGAALAGGPLGYVAAPLMAFANRPGVQPYALGQAPVQQGARALDAALSRYLSRLNTGPQTLAPQALFEAMRDTPQETP